jgi:adenylylsulfate kinase
MATGTKVPPSSPPFHKPVNRGIAIWLTGLPSSGKTTLARALVKLLHDTGYKTVWWDGDDVRKNICKDLGFSREDRDENVRRVAWLAATTVGQGYVTVVSMVSPYREARRKAREMVKATGGIFVEVWVDCPVEICKERDVKGLYGMAEAGLLKGMTGVDDPYEEPELWGIDCLSIRVRTNGLSVHQNIDYLFPLVNLVILKSAIADDLEG